MTPSLQGEWACAGAVGFRGIAPHAPRPPLTAPSLPLSLIPSLPLSQDVAARWPTDNPAVALLYSRWLGGRPGSAAARRLLHTSYREREKTVNTAMVANW
mgnify:CR=1 FL=1